MAFYRSMESGLQMISNATHASDVEYDPTTSDLQSNNLQDAILEINDKVNGIDQADQVHYDNTESGLDATFVQDAIDELEDGEGTPTFTSSDVADGAASAWTSVSKLNSGETNKSIFAKMSQMFKNIRFLYKMLGTTDISSIGGGTLTGAISALNSDKTYTRVKGNAEGSYRTGDVNITPANIGLGNVNNTADANKSVNYANSAGSATNATNATYVSGFHGVVHRRTGSGTTSVNGNLATTIDNSASIIMVNINDASGWAVPYFEASKGAWYLHVVSDGSGQPAKGNTAVNWTVWFVYNDSVGA